jgi:pimeloyl-ACP methyl ester carboxylesterase
MKLSTVLIFCLAFELCCPFTLFAQDQNLILHGSIPKNNKQDSIQFGVMLPPSYNNERIYPVIYYLHGLNGFYADRQAQKVAEFFTTHSSNGDIPACIVVFPDGGEGFWCDHYDQEPLLETEMIKFLIPAIDQNYGVDTKRRLIMGWSAGGFGSMYFFSKYPKLFKAAISLDGPLISWEGFVSFQGERPKIVNNSDYYYKYASPNKWIAHNSDFIKEKQDTAICLTAALFKESFQNFTPILKNHGIPYKYKELKCRHEFGCVFSESSDDLLFFLSKTLK